MLLDTNIVDDRIRVNERTALLKNLCYKSRNKSDAITYCNISNYELYHIHKRREKSNFKVGFIDCQC